MKSTLATSALLLTTLSGAGFVTALPSMQPGYQNDVVARAINSSGAINGISRDLWIHSSDDFCLLMPPNPVKQDIVGALDNAVSYCINPINGTRPMPDGFLKTAHYLHSDKWTQITGTYSSGAMHLSSTDCGTEYDSLAPKGVRLSDGRFFFQFLGGCDDSGESVYCMRICDDYEYCSSAYDQLGCRYVMPGKYEKPDAFTECLADADDPVMVYGGTSTFYQGMKPTPAPRSAPKSSQCSTWASPTPSGITYSWAVQSSSPQVTSVAATLSARPTTLVFPSEAAVSASPSNTKAVASSSPTAASTRSPPASSEQQVSNGGNTTIRQVASVVVAAAAIVASCCLLLI